MTSQTECVLLPVGYPASTSRNDDLRTLLALHAIALGAMSHGLCLLDAEGRIALFNRRLMEIFGLSSEILCLGMSFRTLLELGVMRGHYTRGAFGKTWSDCKKGLEQSKPFILRQRFADRNLVRSHYRPVAAGGWVVIYDDLSEDSFATRGLNRQIDCLYQALNHMSQGLCLFDANERLLFCNEQYLTIYGFDRGVVKPGISYREILDYAVKQRKHANLKSDELLQRIRCCIASLPMDASSRCVKSICLLSP
jgi:PAS domain-containing protein